MARSEERKMLNQFAEEYRTYQIHVPGFILRCGQWRNMVTMRSGNPAKSNQTPSTKPNAERIGNVKTRIKSL
jgi:hypothetical protein